MTPTDNDSTRSGAPKRSYHKPALVRYGNINDITLTTRMGMVVDGQTSIMMMKARDLRSEN